MIPAFSPWLIIILMFAGAFLIFTRVYRIALIWFIRSRINRSWEYRAELITIAASVPFAVVYGLTSVELFFFIGSLASSIPLSFSLLPGLLNFIKDEKVFMVFLLSVMFLAWMVPQTIAGSKIYAYAVDRKARDEVPGQ